MCSKSGELTAELHDFVRDGYQIHTTTCVQKFAANFDLIYVRMIGLIGIVIMLFAPRGLWACSQAALEFTSCPSVNVLCAVGLSKT